MQIWTCTIFIKKSLNIKEENSVIYMFQMQIVIIKVRRFTLIVFQYMKPFNETHLSLFWAKFYRLLKTVSMGRETGISLNTTQRNSIAMNCIRHCWNHCTTVAFTSLCDPIRAFEHFGADYLYNTGKLSIFHGRLQEDWNNAVFLAKN